MSEEPQGAQGTQGVASKAQAATTRHTSHHQEAKKKPDGQELDPYLNPVAGPSHQRPPAYKSRVLCDYSDSSSDEEQHLLALRERKKVSSSPKKRRRPANKPGQKYCPKNLPLDEDGNLDAEKLFGGGYDAVAALTKSLEELLPTEDQESQQEFDFDTLEFKTVFKKQKREDSPPIKDCSDNTKDIDKTSDQEESFSLPKLRNRKFVFKPFRRDEASGRLEHDERGAVVDVVIPEQLAASYGLYIWPASPVLSWYLWLHQDTIRNRRVLELGAGTSLPGLLCAKIGAERVFLADIASKSNVLKNCQEAIRLNKLEDRVEVAQITWGSYEPDLLRLRGGLDLIIGSDLFFDPSVFGPLCCTLSFLLEAGDPDLRALISVQDRSGDWHLDEHFSRWNLRGRLILPREFLKGTGMEEGDLTGKHNIYILEITCDRTGGPRSSI